MKITKEVWLLAALFLLSGCGRKPAETAPKPTPVPAGPAIGFFAPMSGPQASFGSDAVNGATLAVEEVNAGGGLLAQPCRLVIKDTHSVPEDAVAAVADLIDKDKVIALVGEIASDRSLAAATVAQSRGIPMLTPGATSDSVTAIGPFIFRACYTDKFQAAVMAKFARSIDVRRAAILSDQSNPYGKGLADIFKRDFVEHGGEIVAEEAYRAGDTDFTIQLNAIKDKNPEIVFLPSYYAEAALVIKQARKAGIEAPFLGTDGWDSQEFLRVGGAAVDNCYFSSHFSSERSAERVKQFSEAYAAKYGAPPPPLAALAYDAVHLMASAVTRAGNGQPEAIKDALASTRDFGGVTGTITFDDFRNPQKPGIVIRVDEGKFSYLETVAPERK